jgi:hypothetical protein
LCKGALAQVAVALGCQKPRWGSTNSVMVEANGGDWSAIARPIQLVVGWDVIQDGRLAVGSQPRFGAPPMELSPIRVEGRRADAHKAVRHRPPDKDRGETVGRYDQQTRCTPKCLSLMNVTRPLVHLCLALLELFVMGWDQSGEDDANELETTLGMEGRKERKERRKKKGKKEGTFSPSTSTPWHRCQGSALQAKLWQSYRYTGPLSRMSRVYISLGSPSRHKSIPGRRLCPCVTTG